MLGFILRYGVSTPISFATLTVALTLAGRGGGGGGRQLCSLPNRGLRSYDFAILHRLLYQSLRSLHIGSNDMFIGGAFLTLFSAWALWGWTVGESRNIKPLRKTCGPIFVLTATLLVAGGTILATQASMKRQAEENVRELLTGIHDRLQRGQADLVQKQLQSLIDDDPDEDPKDLMASLPEAASVLFVDQPKVQLATEVPNFDDHRRQ